MQNPIANAGECLQSCSESMDHSRRRKRGHDAPIANSGTRRKAQWIVHFDASFVTSAEQRILSTVRFDMCSKYVYCMQKKTVNSNGIEGCLGPTW